MIMMKLKNMGFHFICIISCMLIKNVLFQCVYFNTFIHKVRLKKPKQLKHAFIALIPLKVGRQM